MKEYLLKSMSYGGYIALIDGLLAEGKTTGPNQSEAMFNYGKLNRQRMQRIGKTAVLGEAVKAKANGNERPMIWLVITEGWCGDAAQNIPVIEKIANESPLIETRYILRDENPELMDAYLTNGARSIPKLIALDGETLAELGTWGPRPKAAMDYFYEMRDAGLEKPVMMENLQRWYIEDKNRSIQAEFEALIEQWAGEKGTEAASAGQGA